MKEYREGIRVYRDENDWIWLWHGTTNGNVQEMYLDDKSAHDLLHELDALLRKLDNSNEEVDNEANIT